MYQKILVPPWGGFLHPKMFKNPPYDSDFLKVIRFCWKFALWAIWWCWIHFLCYFEPKSFCDHLGGGHFYPLECWPLWFLKVVRFGGEFAFWVIWCCWIHFFLLILFYYLFIVIIFTAFRLAASIFMFFFFFIWPPPRDLSIARLLFFTWSCVSIWLR